MSDRRDDSPQRACDLLAAYEMGLLEDRDRATFESHLDSCPDCLDEIYALAPAAVAMAEEPGRFAAAAAAGLRAERSAGRVGLLARLAGLLRPRALVPAVAALAVAVLVIGPVLRQGPDYGSLAVLDPLPYARIEVRAGSDTAAELFSRGMDRYLQEDYAGAAGLLGQAAADLAGRPDGSPRPPVGLHDQTRIYLGVSLLLAGRPEEALAPLEEALATPLPPLQERARWYLAQARLLTRDPEGAAGLLQDLVGSRTYGARAEALLDQLSSM